jgi:hypothetical protein
MNPKLNVFLNLAGLSLVIAVNALANILPINGLNTGQISGFYPNYFVPAGFTFSIWGIIYIMLIGFVVFSIAISFGAADTASAKIMDQISLPFQVTCLLNAGWIVAWHYLQLGFSLIIMVGLLVFLAKIFIRIRKLEKPSRVSYGFWLEQPFIVYLAWISVATIANVTALLVGIGWQGGSIDPTIWSTVMILIAFLLGIFFIIRFRAYAYPLVLSWAFFGIYSNQIAVSTIVGYAALFACSALLALNFSTMVKLKKSSINP